MKQKGIIAFLLFALLATASWAYPLELLASPTALTTSSTSSWTRLIASRLRPNQGAGVALGGSNGSPPSTRRPSRYSLYVLPGTQV